MRCVYVGVVVHAGDEKKKQHPGSVGSVGSGLLGRGRFNCAFLYGADNAVR